MTHEEYLKKINEYTDKLANYEGDDYDDFYDEWYEEVSEFQMTYMEEVLAEYKKKTKTEAQKYISEILDYAIHESESGSTVIYVPTKEKADEIDKIIWEEIGEYMLDAPEIYEDEDGEWAIDCMFGGAFVPYWDGWLDDLDD